MIRLYTATVSGFVAIFGLVSTAQGAPPQLSPISRTPQIASACAEDPALARQFALNFGIGARIVNGAVRRVNDCDEIDGVGDFILDTVLAFEPPPGASDALRCRQAGLLDGALAELDNQNFACADQCTDDGSTFGELAAAAYCNLSLLLDGLDEPDPLQRRPVNVCGALYEISCDSAFIASSRADSQCQEYTKAPYTEAWDESRNNQCAYEPCDPTGSSGPSCS